MRKGIVKRCLCIALASAMVFGDVGIASAAESNSTDGNEVVSVMAEEGDADLAASVPNISNFYLGDGYSDGQYGYNVSASIYAYKAVLLVNGKTIASSCSGYDNGYIYLSGNWAKRPGTEYTVELRYANKDGKVYKVQKKKYAESVKIKGISSKSVSNFVDANGIAKPSGVYVEAQVDNPDYINFKYEVYRSSKPNGGYKRIAVGTNSGWGVTYTDTDVKVGSAYYYKVRVLRGTDKYVPKDKVLSVSAATGVRYGKPECDYASAYIYGIDEGGKTCIASLSMSSEFANQYDIYRSTSEKTGYKKIGTVYTAYFTDSKVKKGTVYYYKVVPKYYDSKTGKTMTGSATEPMAVKYIMGTPSVTLTQVTSTAIKCEWYGGNSADVSYEIWYKRNDIDGDAYKKAVVTKNTSCTLKNLAPDGTYKVRIRTVKKAGSVVKYEYSYSDTYQMGYSTKIDGFSISPIKSVADAKKGVVVVYYNLSWSSDWGASGYYVRAYNRLTKKYETLKKLSAKTTSYTLRNAADKKNGIKYTNIQVIPYRGSKVGEVAGSYSADSMPTVSRVKVTRKSASSAVVAWTPVPGATKYVVTRRTPLGVSQYLGETSSTKFLDTHFTNGLDYSYSVYVKSSIVGFGMGNSAETMYKHVLTRPSISSGTNSSAGTAAIKWGRIANAKCYKIYRSDSVNGRYVQVAKTAQNVTVYADKKLSRGKTYYYKVVAYTVNGCGMVVKSNASAARAVKINK